MWILLYPLLEVYVFYKFVQTYSFWDGILFLISSALLGLLLLSLMGQAVFLNLKDDLSAGKTPSNKVVHRGCIMLAGILFIVPGFLSDILAVLLVLPGTRHLFILYFKNKIFRGLQKGNVRFFSNANFRNQSFGQDVRTERDAQVVDVTPIEITHENIKGD